MEFEYMHGNSHLDWTHVTALPIGPKQATGGGN